jgi:hypothetical protein
MLDMGQQPRMIPFGNRVPGQWHQLAAAQRCQVSAARHALRRAIGAAPDLETTHGWLPVPLTEERRFSDRKIPRPITEHYAMPVIPVLEVIVKPLLGAQALKKLQVRFPVLRAEITGRVIASHFNAPILIDNAVLPENLIKYLRHRTAAENALAETLGQTSEFRPQPNLTEPDPQAMIALDQFMQLSMNAVSRRPEQQGCRTVQQAGEVERRIFDQQVHVEHERLADGFSTGKGQNLEGIGQTCYVQTK